MSAPTLRLMRGAAAELRDAELELLLVEKYFDKSAETGARVLTATQLRTFAAAIRRSRLVCAAVRGDQ